MAKKEKRIVFQMACTERTMYRLKKLSDKNERGMSQMVRDLIDDRYVRTVGK